MRLPNILSLAAAVALVAGCGQAKAPPTAAEAATGTGATTPATAAATLAQPTGERPADCELVVRGRTYIDGQCRFSPFGGDGSFQITGRDYFAYLTVTAPGVAEASWNADPASTHAQAPLGRMTRQGACWTNADARICVRDLSAADRAAAVAAQPDGMALWPEEASQACLGVDGPVEVGAAVTLRNCHVPDDLVFGVDAAGALRGPGGLCLDLEAPGMGRMAMLILNACPASVTGWTTTATATHAGPVRDADGRCLTIPKMRDPANPAFPYAVTAASCDQAQRFFLGKG